MLALPVRLNLMFRRVKQLIQKAFLGDHGVQNLQDYVMTLLEFQTFAHDRDDHEDRYGDPGLALRRVLRGAEE